MKIVNLAGVFSGEGFLLKRGRKPTARDTGFLRGLMTIDIESTSGKIRNVERQAVSVAPGPETHDAAGLVAIAAFSDSHTHALFAGSRAREYFMRWQGQSYQEISAAGGGIHNTVQETTKASDESLLDTLKRRLNEMRLHGSLCVEVKTGYGLTPAEELRHLRLLKKFRSSPRCPVEMKITFLALHAIPPGLSESNYVDQMIGALDTVAQEKLADYVDAFPEKGFFSIEQTLRFVAEAKKRGLKVKIHADEMSPLGSSETFAREGAISVDHLQKISAAGITELTQRDCIATLLPATSFFVGLPYAPARKLLDGGARVALATDFNPGTAPENNLLFSARLAAQHLQMTPAEILCALTLNAAGAVGEDHRRGLIKPGYLADILLFKPHGLVENFLEELFIEAPQAHTIFRHGKV